jgi:hypothetical protein
MRIAFIVQFVFITTIIVLAMLNRRRLRQRPRYGVDIPPPPSHVCSKFPFWAVVLAGVFFAFGLAWLANVAWRISRSVKTTGIILLVQHRFDHNRPGRSQSVNTPIFIFQDGNSVWHTNKPSISSSGTRLQSGDQVAVYYNPENPQDALLDSFNFTYSIPFFFTVFGGIMLTFGIVQRLKIKQRPKLP